MEENKNLVEKSEDSNEKLHLSGVMRSFTLDDMKKCFIQGYTKHAEGFNMNIYDGEFHIVENIFDEWIKNYA